MVSNTFLSKIVGDAERIWENRVYFSFKMLLGQSSGSIRLYRLAQDWLLRYSNKCRVYTDT